MAPGVDEPLSPDACGRRARESVAAPFGGKLSLCALLTKSENRGDETPIELFVAGAGAMSPLVLALIQATTNLIETTNFRPQFTIL